MDDDALWSPTAFPPGVNGDGVVDASALAAAHADTLSNRSYRVTFVHRESVGGRPTGVARETADVAGPARYRSDVTEVGRLRGSPLVVADGSTYANGTARFERVATDSYRIAPLDPEAGDPFARRTATYLEWFLTVDDSRVVDAYGTGGRTHFWLKLSGDPWPGAENVTGSALVDERGRVHEVRRSHTLPDDPAVRVVVRIRVSDTDEGAPDPPAWVADAAATADSAPVADDDGGQD